jgi:hypothetical protein
MNRYEQSQQELNLHPLPNISLGINFKNISNTNKIYKANANRKIHLYLITAQEYNENLSRVKCVG